MRSIIFDYQAELLRIAPDLRRWLPGEAYRQADFVGDTAEYIYRAIATLLIELSTVQPITLCIDDLQWADRSSLDLLRHLSAGLAQSRVASQADSTAEPQLAIFCTARTGYQRWDEYLAGGIAEPSAHVTVGTTDSGRDWRTCRAAVELPCR